METSMKPIKITMKKEKSIAKTNGMMTEKTEKCFGRSAKGRVERSAKERVEFSGQGSVKRSAKERVERSVQGCVKRSAKGSVRMCEKLRQCVSRKFYVDIDNRLREAADCIGGGDETYAAMKAMIDMYISEGVVAEEDADASLRLVFAMLRPEIDKAMCRSRRARELAKGRKAKIAVEPAESQESDCHCCQASEPVAKSADCEENTRIDSCVIPTDSDIERVITMAMREVAEEDSITYRMTRRQRRRLEQERRRRFGKTKNVPLGK